MNQQNRIPGQLKISSFATKVDQKASIVQGRLSQEYDWKTKSCEKLDQVTGSIVKFQFDWHGRKRNRMMKNCLGKFFTFDTEA